MRLQILYEDNHLLVVNKPAGLLTQPSGTKQNNLEDLCKSYIKTKCKKTGAVFLEAVHRLDKPVSGVVVFARTSKALTRLHTAIREKNCQKTYIAAVEGVPTSLEGTLDDDIVHLSHAASVDANHPKAKNAVLHYKLIGHWEKGAILEIILETGRYHQIRIQLASMGCPIKGDFKYGSKIPFENDCIALHHARMEISHPVSGLPLLFESPCPFYN